MDDEQVSASGKCRSTDQRWDLPRQRRARRVFGQNADEAVERVEGYIYTDSVRQAEDGSCASVLVVLPRDTRHDVLNIGVHLYFLPNRPRGSEAGQPGFEIDRIDADGAMAKTHGAKITCGNGTLDRARGDDGPIGRLLVCHQRTKQVSAANG
jgi:Protein of unknown function (DUF2630)